MNGFLKNRGNLVHLYMQSTCRALEFYSYELVSYSQNCNMKIK